MMGNLGIAGPSRQVPAFKVVWFLYVAWAFVALAMNRSGVGVLADLAAGWTIAHAFDRMRS